MFRVRLVNPEGGVLDYVGDFDGKVPASLKRVDGLPAAAYAPVNLDQAGDEFDVEAWEQLHEAEKKLVASARKRPSATIAIGE